MTIHQIRSRREALQGEQAHQPVSLMGGIERAAIEPDPHPAGGAGQDGPVRRAECESLPGSRSRAGLTRTENPILE